jgi:hypothetical protein
MEVLVLQGNHGSAGLKEPAPSDDRAPEHERNAAEAALFNWRQSCRVLVMQQQTWAGAWSSSEARLFTQAELVALRVLLDSIENQG